MLDFVRTIGSWLRLRRAAVLFLLIICWMAQVEPSSHAQCADPDPTIRFVRATGGSDSYSGECWEEAFATLQKALDAVNEENSTVTQIRIAKGTYKPSGTNGSFVLENACAIRGGYRGYTDGGGNADDRHFDDYETILSGDLSGDDTPSTPSSYNDNSFHVMRILSSVVDVTEIDGVTVKAGNARSSGDDAVGGGLHATYGGTQGAEVRIVDCRFIKNWAKEKGGAVGAYRRSLRIRRCHFEDNIVTGETQPAFGGAIWGSSNVRIVSSAFIGNLVNGDYGQGGAVIGAGSLTDISNCEFRGNSIDGGATFSWGGALIVKGDASIRSCLFAGNTTTAFGGAIAAIDNGTVHIRNCTIADNEAGNGAGGVYAAGGIGHLTRIRNSILTGNAVDGDPDSYDAQVAGSSSISIEYSCVTDILSGTGNVDLPPSFVDASGGNYRLLKESALIDLGTDSEIGIDSLDVDEANGDTEPLPWDLDRTMRVKRCEVDMGAFEDPACQADFNDDCEVDGDDLGTLLGNWGEEGGYGEADFNCDGIVDGDDMGTLLGEWGDCAACAEESLSRGSSAGMTPAELAEQLAFESVQEMASWLETLEIGEMTEALEPLLGN